jgi:hypothetical protein
VPLLKAYNKQHAGNRKLHFQTKVQVTPKLAKGPASLFHRFTTNANMTLLSHASWEHFYSFIISCHQRNEYVAGEDLEYLLAEGGFGGYHREKLCTVFEHCWRLLDQLPENQLRALKRRLRKKERPFR